MFGQYQISIVESFSTLIRQFYAPWLLVGQRAMETLEDFWAAQETEDLSKMELSHSDRQRDVASKAFPTVSLKSELFYRGLMLMPTESHHNVGLQQY